MESIESPLQEQGVCTSCTRGGPIFSPGSIGPLTSVPEFEASVLQHLDSLEAELSMDLTQSCEDDLSVDDLKIFTEEELVDKAFKEAFQVAEQVEKSSQLSVQHCEMKNGDLETPNQDLACVENSKQECNKFQASNSLNETEQESNNYSEITDQQNSKKKNKRGKVYGSYHALERSDQQVSKKKRGRVFDRSVRAAELESDYIAKVEQLAKIKQKQDDDKAEVKLHSFNAKIAEGSVSTSETKERMKSLRFITSAAKVMSSSTNEHVGMRYPEVVLCIEIYHNIRKWHKMFVLANPEQYWQHQMPVFVQFIIESCLMQEFLVLGRQTLSDLRDKIYCLTDHLLQKAGEHDPSGYFLIENLFCNDLRDPSAIDYSEPIFDWIKNFKDEALAKWKAILNGGFKKMQKALLRDIETSLGKETSNLPHFKAVDMHKTLFCDLRFRLGAGYLYCHQGDCKHMLVIRDMRLIHPEDVQNKAAYPLLTYQPRKRYLKCTICDIYRATKVTCDDKWAPKNPSYFCDNCYFLLHYSEDGSLLYNNFTVYDYYHE